MRLTKRTVDEITAPGYALHWDDEITGFGLRVRAGGKKAYSQRRIHGKDRGLCLEGGRPEGRRGRGRDQGDRVRLANIFGGTYTVTDRVTDR